MHVKFNYIIIIIHSLYIYIHDLFQDAHLVCLQRNGTWDFKNPFVI